MADKILLTKKGAELLGLVMKNCDQPSPCPCVLCSQRHDCKLYKIEWVSVKERYPEHDGVYLVFMESEDLPHKRFDVAFYQTYMVIKPRFYTKEHGINAHDIITHWMAIEEPKGVTR